MWRWVQTVYRLIPTEPAAPDYLEDANGNGVVDSGEIDWQVAGDLGLTVVITQPAANSASFLDAGKPPTKRTYEKLLQRSKGN